MPSIETVWKTAGQLPHVTEDIKWGNDLCFCIAAKMFCITGLEGEVKVSLKVTDEEFEKLIECEGIIPAPYMARNKWVLISAEAKLRKGKLGRLIKQSYELVKAKLPKKVQRGLAA